MVDLKQQECRQRGEDFQQELRRSWHYVNNCWRMRITDKNSGTRPADDVILLRYINILAEAKRTSGDAFTLSMVRTNQQKGLWDFDSVIPRNKGLIFISFLSTEVDEAYAFRFVDALRYMRNNGTQSIPLEDIRAGQQLKRVYLPLKHDKNGDRYYDLKGVEQCYK